DNYLNTLFIQRVLYENLGGGNSVRGMMANRILAKGVAYANVEFRFRVVDFDIGHQHFFVGLNPFFDLGMVTQPYKLNDLSIARTGRSLAENVMLSGEDYNQYFSNHEESDIYRPHITAGVGLKIGMNENFVLSADWAMPVNEKYYMNQDNNKLANFYVKMGYLF
ncbi:MAG: BamA/TamA family outer membrane protein, partial [Paludibacteraceae bacterium]|nr:BamA/TamA family outer membrane protein [Paludibacteraceae bacterium]